MTTSGPAAQAADVSAVYRFGDVTLDLDRFELRRGGVPQRVEPQVLEVLAYLIRHRDRLVTKTELMDRIWHDRFVSDSAVTSRIKAARRVTGDDGERQEVIRTVHGRGYRFVAPVAEPARPSAQDTVAPARLVGREDELTLLHASLARARAGRRQVVFISGEPGIGKTTLVEAFLAGLPPGGGMVGAGQCHPVGVGEPYAPVLDALSYLADGPAADGVRRCLDAHAPGWLLQLPALVDAGHAAELVTRTLGSTPERRLREALDLVDALASLDGQPLVLLIEDLHWADQATLDLITAVTRRRRPVPLLLLGTYRHTDLGDRHVLPQTVAELATRGLAIDLRLEALSLPAVRELVARRGGITRPSAVDALHRRSGGNPLFLGALLDAQAGQAAGEPVRLPRNLRELVESHLARLEPADRDLLDVAAVAGIEFRVELLGRGSEVDDIWSRCEALARRDQLVGFDERGRPGGFRFRHAIYQEVTYSRIPKPRRRALHQVVGERLEATTGDQASSVTELAEHFTRAGDGPRAVRYRLDAAGVAALRSAPAAALDHLQEGLAMLALIPEGEQRRRYEAELQFSLAAMALTVDGWASVRGERALRRARELYLGLGDTAAANRATYGLAGLHEYRGEFDRSQALMAQRLRTAAGDERALVELHDILACSAFHLGEFRNALRHAEEAVSRYDPVRDRAALAVVGENPFVTSQHWAAYSLWFTGRPDTALERSDAAVRLARRPDHAFSLCLALEAAAVLRQFRREPARVLELAEQMLTLAVESGLPYRQATAGVLLAWARGCLGEPAEGCRALDAALGAYQRTGAAMDLPYFTVLYADVARLAGQQEAAQRALERARTLTEARPSFIEAEIERLTGVLLLQAGADPRIVETHLRSALSIARERDALSLELRAAADLRRLQLTHGRPADAATVLRSVMERFTEGLDTVDMREAAALLAP